MKIEIYIPKWNGEKLEVSNSGYIEMDTFDRDKCWELCNWGAYADKKPEEVHSEISGCSTDICFYDSDSNIYHLPESIGWKEVDSLEKVIEIWNTQKMTVAICKLAYAYNKSHN